ncbi:Rep family protein, partial [Clostridioides difficile]
MVLLSRLTRFVPSEKTADFFMAKNVKKRNWAVVLYPESAPENWRE